MDFHDLEDSSSQTSVKKIDKAKNRYPFSIVWTSIPCISYIFPCIGHTGICT
jgi:hypothetical protein